MPGDGNRDLLASVPRELKQVLAAPVRVFGQPDLPSPYTVNLQIDPPYPGRPKNAPKHRLLPERSNRQPLQEQQVAQGQAEQDWDTNGEEEQVEGQKVSRPLLEGYGKEWGDARAYPEVSFSRRSADQTVGSKHLGRGTASTFPCLSDHGATSAPRDADRRSRGLSQSVVEVECARPSCDLESSYAVRSRWRPLEKTARRADRGRTDGQQMGAVGAVDWAAHRIISHAMRIRILFVSIPDRSCCCDIEKDSTPSPCLSLIDRRCLRHGRYNAHDSRFSARLYRPRRK